VSLVLLLLFFAPDLAPVKSEPDLQKRSELALSNADREIDTARNAYKSGDLGKMSTALDEVRDSVNLCFESLEERHKKARNDKYYKRAELKVRALLRRLKSLSDEVDLDQRKQVEAVHQRLQEVHDQLIAAIMRK
jgi:hypothetical protein